METVGRKTAGERSGVYALRNGGFETEDTAGGKKGRQTVREIGGESEVKL